MEKNEVLAQNTIASCFITICLPPSIPISLMGPFFFLCLQIFFSLCFLSVCLQLSRLCELTSYKETFWMGILMALTTDSVCPDVSLEGNVIGFIYQVQACVYV